MNLRPSGYEPDDDRLKRPSDVAFRNPPFCADPCADLPEGYSSVLRYPFDTSVVMPPESQAYGLQPVLERVGVTVPDDSPLRLVMNSLFDGLLGTPIRGASC